MIFLGIFTGTMASVAAYGAATGGLGHMPGLACAAFAGFYFFSALALVIGGVIEETK